MNTAAQVQATTAQADVGTGRASKLDGYRDIVGRVPDREVAERTGMTTENVRMYRVRRGISASWRDEPARDIAARASAAAAVRPEVKSEVKPVKTVAFAVTPVVEERPKTKTRTRVNLPRSSATVEPALDVRLARSPVGPQQLFRVTASRDGVTSRFGLVAADILAATTRAQQQLAPTWRVESVRAVDVTLI